MTTQIQISQFEITSKIVNEYREEVDKYLYCLYLLESYEMPDSDDDIEQLEQVLESIDISSLTK